MDNGQLTMKIFVKLNNLMKGSIRYVFLVYARKN